MEPVSASCIPRYSLLSLSFATVVQNIIQSAGGERMDEACKG